MIEYLQTLGCNIWQWFVENKDAITAFFMSGQAISFVAAIVMLIRNLKGTKDNTKSSNELNSTLIKNNEMSKSVNVMGKNFATMTEENKNLKIALQETEAKLEHANSLITGKLDAIIEVQAIVYSTIRDDGVRMTVNKILNNARYSDTNFKQELESQIEDLKQMYTDELNKINEKMSNSMDNITAQLSSTDVAVESMEAGHGILRY